VSYDTINCIEYSYLVLDTIYFARSKFCPSEAAFPALQAELMSEVKQAQEAIDKAKAKGEQATMDMFH
jgi:hypothetical protein